MSRGGEPGRFGYPTITGPESVYALSRMCFNKLYLAVAHLERFSATDRRRTLSSIGPDIGHTIDIGAVLAATDPLSLDVVAGALLKRAYDSTPGPLAGLAPGAGVLLEFLAGRTWLPQGTPFDLLGHIAANSYGVGPLDAAHLALVGMENSGFPPEELDEIRSYLQGNQS